MAMATATTGCTADDPTPPNYDLGSKQDILEVPDFPPGCTKQPVVGQPVLEVYANPTSYARLPLRGTCAKASKITAKGGAGTFQADVGSSSKFCIELTLLPDTSNSFTLHCLDGQGCPGPPLKISINHKTTPKSDAGINVPINLAKNQPITSLPAPKSGSLKSVVDGKIGSFASFEFWDRDIIGPGEFDNCSWIKVDLGKSYTVSEFKITWYSQQKYGQGYVILTSSTTATDPKCDKANVGWQVQKQEKAGDYKPQSIKISPVAARWVALLMYEDEAKGFYEYFDLDEFEVWGQDPDATPPPPPDKCK